MHDEGIWRLESRGGEVGCCDWIWGCVGFRVLLGVARRDVCVGVFDGVGVIGWEMHGLV